MVDAAGEVTIFVPVLARDPVQPSPVEPPEAVQLVVLGGEFQLKVIGVFTIALEALAVSAVRLPVNVT